MKSFKIYHVIAFMAMGLLVIACEKNEVLPAYEKTGTSTATIATISVSNKTPLPGALDTLTLHYVNLSEDPAKQIQLLGKVGDGEFTEITTLDESATPADQEITRTFVYTVPNVADGTPIVLDMVLNSQKQFPQRERATLKVTVPEAGEG